MSRKRREKGRAAANARRANCHNECGACGYQWDGDAKHTCKGVLSGSPDGHECKGTPSYREEENGPDGDPPKRYLRCTTCLKVWGPIVAPEGDGP